MEEFFRQIANSDEGAFTKTFYHYNKRIYPYLLKKVQSEDIAREMVQDVSLNYGSFVTPLIIPRRICSA